VVCDSDFSRAAYSQETVERLRQAKFLVVFGWADSPLAQMADVVLPVAHHGEKDGTFVNVEWRLQKFVSAFPAPGQVRPTLEVLSDLLSRFDPSWGGLTTGKVFDRMASMAGGIPAFAGLSWHSLPATGASLNVPGTHTRIPDQPAEAVPEVAS
jgi:predicted molibdopterin-dependent oxidoreductase YjgC